MTKPAAALGSPPAIDDPSFNGFVTTLLARGDGPAALTALLQSIDESSWAASPVGNGVSNGAAALAGQPIAVVRAAVGIAPDGLTAVSLRFEDIKAEYSSTPPIGLPAIYALPVMIGSPAHLDNGVLGYFANRQFGTFYATHMPHTPDAAYVVSAAATPVQVPVTVRRPPAAAPATVAPEETVDFVVLMEPRGVL